MIHKMDASYTDTMKIHIITWDYNGIAPILSMLYHEFGAQTNISETVQTCIIHKTDNGQICSQKHN